ncbi:MAG: phosphatidate cytidylyltransferase [Gemmobacter sp.]|jgi:phosphatidate cytidylyltransferase|nr:phosphatidate cytidylyltransferase [Gemmobacter sp.]
MSGLLARWPDLGPRLVSAAVMVVAGLGAIWCGGAVFSALVLVVTGLMLWELARMTAAPRGIPASGLGLSAAGALALALLFPQAALPFLPLPALAGIARPRRDRTVFFLYALLILATGYGLIALRGLGLAPILWIVAVVVASDVLGYFAGRSLGGPKFWPAVSPKKTWSGTVAGWIGAALVGLGFHLSGQGGASLIWLSALMGFAGQMGDIAESAVKRRAGVKDSSNLIPGHGGVLDRFDALATATVLALALHWLGCLPVG